jgi:glycine/D-amino acid oxidase-like deaminating enzyme
MVRQVVSDPAVAALARDGAAFFRELPADWPIPGIFQQSGSLLLGSGEVWKGLECDAEAAGKLGIGVECWSRQKTEELVPALRGAEFDRAVWCPSDGVVDIHGLLSGYLKGITALGIQVRYGCAVQGIDVRGGRVTGVLTSDGMIQTEAVINAAGAWAGMIGKHAGATAVPLHPCRRHLFVTGPLPWVDPGWPFVWDVAHGVYFRPDSGGLLVCPCDQEEMAPCIPPTDESVAELLADKVKRHLPGISDIAIRKSWAGLRTLSGDGRFIIGWDSKVQGFFWVAGLGGHGVTTSSAVGELAASLILKGGAVKSKDFSVERFLS